MTTINLVLLHDLVLIFHLVIACLCIVLLSDFIDRLELINLLDLMEGLFPYFWWIDFDKLRFFRFGALMACSCYYKRSSSLISRLLMHHRLYSRLSFGAF